jgi:UDP-N-acetylmuramoyl-L-alanyl-D-glutamate--2,6-diaminopimelate ligase
MPISLFDLLQSVPDVIHVSADAQISASVVEDNRMVEPGGVFVARPGLSVDGHSFIPDAIRRGAAAIVGQQTLHDLPVPYVQVKDSQESTGYLAAAYHGYPACKLVIIGVTGTDGKTTTSTLLHSILQTATAGKCGLISTVAACIGDQTLDTGFHVTTPGAPQIQAFLAQMVARELTHCVLEMTSHGLAQGRLNGVDVDVAVLTNLTHEHLDYHGTFEAYRAAKGRMFAMLGQSVRKVGFPKVAVINGDDPNADYFAAFTHDTLALYSLEQMAQFPSVLALPLHQQVHPESITLQPDHTEIHIAFPSSAIGRISLSTSLLGHFNVYNVLAAVTVASVLGVSKESTIKGIGQIHAIPGRMQRIDEGQSFTAIVDFAHTPNALENALQACRDILPPGNRLITVFGSAGLRDREKRRLMPQVAARLADFTVLTAEDPRTESLTEILAGMAVTMTEAGGREGETFIRVLDRGEALYRACQLAQPGDIVIACGKGHEQSMCFGTVEYPWDDADALRAALRGNPLRTLPTAAS